MGLEGGYASTRLGSDTFNVIFQGNAFTPWSTAEFYALYRGAEVTVESGYEYFVVVGGAGGAPLTPSTLQTSPVPDGRDTDYPRVSLVIRAFPGPKPSADAFNARDVLRDLGPSIKRP
jgi:hypothetical protein